MIRTHIIGGFLGSGKTTAIINAAKQLIKRGRRVGVITNDQGKYLVDTAFFTAEDIPAVEVTGGCFCCNYDDFNARMEQLVSTVRPDVVFAESVGSCADIVATVVKPLLALKKANTYPISFSVFVDIRLLQLRLAGRSLPFNDNIIYIFDKQIEEAGLLVINKRDLMDTELAANVLVEARRRFPGKDIILQNSFNTNDTTSWLRMITSRQGTKGLQTLKIDYERYGAGESGLAWLDERIILKSGANGKEIAVGSMIEKVAEIILNEGITIGHLKFFISDGRRNFKVSFSTLKENDCENQIPTFSEEDIIIIINARVASEATRLRDAVRRAISAWADGSSIQIEKDEVAFFHPALPRPKHRMA